MSFSIADMQNIAENLDGSDIKISSTVGNVIELGEDLGDDMGIGLLSNNRSSSSRPAAPSAPMFNSVDDIGVTSLEPLESISFDLPSDGKDAAPLPDVFIHKDTSSGFSNDQSATGPSIQLSSANRLSP